MGALSAVRTCVACRRRGARQELLRFVADGRGHLQLDARQRAAGRAAYVCATRRCLEEACRRAAFARGLRRGVAVVEPRAFVEGTLATLVEETRGLALRAVADGRARRTVRPEVEGLMVEPIERRLEHALAGLLAQVRGLGCEAPTAPRVEEK
jgi:predicted RNA-binding protein YlxR (DUF448 family)